MSIGRKYDLPKDIGGHIKRLLIEYKRRGDDPARIIDNSWFWVNKNVERDGYAYYHDVLFYIEEEKLEKISLKEQQQIEIQIEQDIRSLSLNVRNEDIGRVLLRVFDKRNPNMLPVHGVTKLDPQLVKHWPEDHIRVFISHHHKDEPVARRLQSELIKFRIASFVAHKEITVSKAWRTEIENSLASMEFIVAIVMQGFSKSAWANQEIGFAEASRIPIFSWVLEDEDPEAFAESKQYYKGVVNDMDGVIYNILKSMGEYISDDHRFRRSLIEWFGQSNGYDSPERRFTVLKNFIAKSGKLSPAEETFIVNYYNENPWIYGSFHLQEHIIDFLSQGSSGIYRLDPDNKERKGNATTKLIKGDDDIPF